MTKNVHVIFVVPSASSEILDSHFQLRVKRHRNLENPDVPTPAEFFLIVEGRPTTNLMHMLMTRHQNRAGGGHGGGGGGGGSGIADPSLTQRPPVVPLANSSSIGVVAQPSPQSSSVMASTEPFRPLDLPTNRQHSVTIVYVQSPAEFWCQLVEEASVLEQLMDFLQLAFDQRTLRALERWPPQPRQAVAARFTDDDAWYRAVVTSVVDAGKVEVLFVDFGRWSQR